MLSFCIVTVIISYDHDSAMGTHVDTTDAIQFICM